MSYTNVAGKSIPRPEMLPNLENWYVPWELRNELTDLVFAPTTSRRTFRWPSDPSDSPRLSRLQMMRRALALTYKKRRGRHAYYLDAFPNAPDIDLRNILLHMTHIQDPVIYFLYNHMVVPIRQQQWDQAHGQVVAHVPKRLEMMKRKREELDNAIAQDRQEINQRYEEEMREMDVGGF